MNSDSDNPARSRQDRLIHERVHDPYKTRLKLPEPTVCPRCHAVYLGGRWQWAQTRPKAAHEEMCQACHRVEDGYPAGEVTLTGAFALAHRAEILNLIRNLEKEENAEHPLHRIMRLEERAEALVVNTTDIHLPRRLGDALHHAYKGERQLHYDEEGYFVRVHWRRDD